MGVYARFKRNPDGLRQLVELLETTPIARRKKMIDVGMKEDPEYTEKALEYVLTFDDVLKLPDHELAEVLGEVPARIIGLAIYALPQEITVRFLGKLHPQVAAEVKEVLAASQPDSTQMGACQLRLVAMTRKLEKRGLVKTKRIFNE